MLATVGFPIIANVLALRLNNNIRTALRAGKTYNDIQIKKIKIPQQTTNELKTYLPKGPKIYKIQQIKKYHKKTFDILPLSVDVKVKKEYSDIIEGFVELPDIPDIPVHKHCVPWTDIKINNHNRENVIKELNLEKHRLILPKYFNLKLYSGFNEIYYFDKTDYFYDKYHDSNYYTKKLYIGDNVNYLIDKHVRKYDDYFVYTFFAIIMGMTFDTWYFIG